MNSKTKIILLHHKHLLYVLIGFILVLLIILFFCLQPKAANASTKPTSSPVPSNHYTAGSYSSSLTLNGKPVQIQVLLDKDTIHQIDIVHLSESIETIFPLFHNCFNDIANQVITNNSTQNITYPEDSQYTSMAILDAIDTALAKSCQ